MLESHKDLFEKAERHNVTVNSKSNALILEGLTSDECGQMLGLGLSQYLKG